MLPREWLSSFGGPSFHIARATEPNTLVIPADPDRYLLAAWITNGPLQMRPDGVDSLWGGIGQFTNGDPPLIFTHALHGSLVNLKWNILMIAGPAIALFIMARAQPGVKPDGRAIQVSTRPGSTRPKRNR